MPEALRIPPLVLARARSNGEAGRQWLEDLPDVLADLAARWDLELGDPLDGGTASYVAAATDGAGRELVLKVAMPLDIHDRDVFTRSVLVHRIAAGQGCVELLDHDEMAAAMLLERLGPNLDALALPLPDLLDAVGATLRSFWQPVGDDVDLPTGADQAAWLASYIAETWESLGRPCERGVVDRAVELCDRRAAAYDPTRSVLVHGDAHGWNTLAAGRSFKLVDPEGLRSSREHDLGIPMREYNEPLLAGDTARLVRERAERLALACDADADAVWEWGFVERVSTGLANLRELEGGGGAAFLEVAARTSDRRA